MSPTPSSVLALAGHEPGWISALHWVAGSLSSLT